MGISSLTNRVSYIGTNSAATFSFPYEFFNQADLTVYLFDATTGTVYPQVLNTNYTVSGSVNAQGIYPLGANVVMASSIVSTTYIVITRSPSQQQIFALGQNGVIPSTALVNQLDYLTLLIQRQQDLQNNSLAIPDGYGSSFNPVLPGYIGLSPGSFLIVNSAASGFDFTPGGGPSGFGISGYPLIANGSGAISSYQQLLLSGVGVTGVLPIANGGTNAASFANIYGPVYYNSNALATVAPGTAGQVLTFNSGAAPSWTTVSGGGGITAVSSGGTNNSNFTQYGVVYGNSSNLAQVAPGTAGYPLTFNSGAAPTYQAISGSAYLSVWPISQGGIGSGPVNNQVLSMGSGYTVPRWSSVLWLGGPGAVGAGGIYLNGTSGSGNIFVGLGSSSLPSGTVNFYLPITVGTAGYPLVSQAGNGPQTYSILGVGAGGTNNSNFINYGVVYGNSSNLAQVAPGTAGQVLVFNSGSAPSWAAAAAIQSSILGIAGGGTGNSNFVQYSVFYSNSTSFLPVAPGTAGQVLTFNSGAAPSWAAAASVQSSILGIAGGGTGNSNFVSYSVFYSNSTSFLPVTPGTTGQYLSFNSGAAPTWATVVGGSGLVSLATGVTGILPYANGGTNTGSSPAVGQMFYVQSGNTNAGWSYAPTIGGNGAGSGQMTFGANTGSCAVTIALGSSSVGPNNVSFYLPQTPGTAGQPLLSNGGNGPQSYGTLSPGAGGTGYNSNFVQYGVVYASSASVLAVIPASSSAGYVLTSNGNASAPTFQAAASGITTRCASYTCSSAFTISPQAWTPFKGFAQQLIDTDNAMNGGTYTCPVSGYYNVTAWITTASVTALTAGQQLSISICQNGSAAISSAKYNVSADGISATSNYYTATVTGIINASANDIIYIMYYYTPGGATTTEGTPQGATGISIYRIN